MGWQSDETDERPPEADSAEATFLAITAMDRASALQGQLIRAQAIMTDCARRRATIETSAAQIRAEYAEAHMTLNKIRTEFETAAAEARKLIEFTPKSEFPELT